LELRCNTHCTGGTKDGTSPSSAHNAYTPFRGTLTKGNVMKKHSTLFIAALLLTLSVSGGCSNDGNDDERDHRVAVAPICHAEQSGYGDYEAYVTEFKDLVEEATGVRPLDLIKSIKWVDAQPEDGKHLLGMCTKWFDHSNKIVSAEITLYPNLRNASPQLERSVLLHELAHCIMNSHHVTDEGDLMHPVVQMNITPDAAQSRIDSYLNRLAKGE